jgi:hypothetical protein
VLLQLAANWARQGCTLQGISSPPVPFLWWGLVHAHQLTTKLLLLLFLGQYKPKKEYYGGEKHEESYSEYKPKKKEPKYYKEEKHEEAYEVSKGRI